jgi:flagellar FliL protein
LKKKLMILVPLLLVVVGGAYKFVLAPKPMVKPPKIAGAVVALQEDFLVNLEGTRYAKVAVALIMKDPAGAAHAPGAGGGLPQEAVIRSIVTEALTGIAPDMLIDPAHRKEVLHHILEGIEEHTDEHVKHVLFTDITVQ